MELHFGQDSVGQRAGGGLLHSHQVVYSRCEAASAFLYSLKPMIRKAMTEFRSAVIVPAHEPPGDAFVLVQRLAQFGSVARGQARPDSDVDLLVQFLSQAGRLMAVSWPYRSCSKHASVAELSS
jgi:hypothetical protein